MRLLPGRIRAQQCLTIHVYSSSKGNDKASNRIRNNTSGLDTFEGHGDCRSRRGTSKGHGLGGNNVAQICERVRAGEKEIKAHVGEKVMEDHGHHGSDHQVSHVLESVCEIFLPSHSLHNQTEHSDCSTEKCNGVRNIVNGSVVAAYS